ncbi:hypothetical protein Hdeb2414_s0002g00052961 [Helianthus debilis subsp. tardiflorus]
MESYDFIDNIKAEKANALARYRTFSNVSKLFQLLEVFVAVAVISWSSSHVPLVFKFSGEYVTSFSSYFANQHVVFLVGNLIVVVCYVLSRYSDSGNELSDSEFHSGSGTELTHRKTVSDGSIAKPVQPQAVRSFKPFEIQNPVIKTVKSELEVAGETVITSETKQNERKFERTRSEKVKSRIPVKADRELRRSVTEMRRSVAVTGGKESVKAVEKLSNEEFRIAVETFIMKQQRFLKEQSMIEDES